MRFVGKNFILVGALTNVTEDQFLQVCSGCDELLYGASDAMAVPWLHVAREHPEAIKQYAHLYDCNPLRELFRTINRNGRNGLGIILQLISCISKPRSFWYSNKTIDEVDILLVSHLISPKHLASEQDFYFSNMANLCKKAGYRVSTVFIDHVGLANQTNADKFNNDELVFLLPRQIGLHGELTLLKQSWSALMSLRQVRPTSKFVDKILKQAKLQAFSRATLNAFRIQNQVSNLLNKLKPKILIFTYEGHSWERLLSALTKKNSANIVSIGYQHASISRLQHAACRSLGAPFDPDYLFTSGLTGKKRLMNDLNNSHLDITVVGGNRTTTSRIASTKPDKFACVLVLPEGLLNECILLLNYSLECAKLAPNLKFIWRQHPILDFDEVLKKCPQFQYLPNNIEFSRGNIENDIKNSSHVLYRGTTAVIMALTSGLRPLYLSVPEEMTIDPLFDLNFWKAIVIKPKDLLDVVYTLNEVSAFEVDQALSYGSLFFTKLSEQNLVNKINSIIINDLS